MPLTKLNFISLTINGADMKNLDEMKIEKASILKRAKLTARTILFSGSFYNSTAEEIREAVDSALMVRIYNGVSKEELLRDINEDIASDGKHLNFLSL